MDSPIINGFLAGSFTIVKPVVEEVDWFYIEEDKVIRHFTFLTNGEGWREVTRQVNKYPVNTSPGPSLGGQCFTDFIATNPVHPAHRNVTPDGLRMHPVIAPTSLGLFSDEEWDSLNSSDEELWSFVVSDAGNITTVCKGKFELPEVNRGKARRPCRRHHPHCGTCFSEKVVGWLKRKLAKKE